MNASKNKINILVISNVISWIAMTLLFLAIFWPKKKVQFDEVTAERANIITSVEKRINSKGFDCLITVTRIVIKLEKHLI